MKMEPTVSSETSAIRTQTPGNHPKRNILHLEHGGKLENKNTKTLQGAKETGHCRVIKQWQLESFSVCGMQNTAVTWWVQIQSTLPVVLNYY